MENHAHAYAPICICFLHTVENTNMEDFNGVQSAWSRNAFQVSQKKIIAGVADLIYTSQPFQTGIEQCAFKNSPEDKRGRGDRTIRCP